MQSYSPYRTSLLTREELSTLCALNPGIVIRDTLFVWLTILVSWAVAATCPYWFVIPFVSIFIGTRVYALLIIAHDGLHRRQFDTVRANDLWNDLLILGSIGAITRLNRVNHMRHHGELALPSDPDRFKYTREGRATLFTFLVSLTCVSLLVKAVRNVLLTHPARKRDGNEVNDENEDSGKLGRYRLRDILIVGLWQLMLIGGLSLLIGWWAYPLLWGVPVVMALCCDILRVFCEHSQLTDDDEADSSMRLVSYDANPVERVIFAPNNMNHHIAHHLWPAIPYYNLSRAESLIRSKLDGDHKLVWRPSYFGHILNYLRWLKGARTT
jgi:fatty acid desaturase